jgi:hypothetical protein
MLISPILTGRGKRRALRGVLMNSRPIPMGSARNRIFRNLLNRLRYLAPGVTMLQPTQPRKRNYSRICSRPLLYCTPVRGVFLQ